MKEGISLFSILKYEIAAVRAILMMNVFLLAIGKFVYGYRTGFLDQPMTDENKRFYEGIKVILRHSTTLSRSKWMKYINRRAYTELKHGMKNCYSNGVQQVKKVMDLVKNAEKSDKDLDDSIGISFCLAKGHCVVIVELCSFINENGIPIIEDSPLNAVGFTNVFLYQNYARSELLQQG